MLQVLDLSFGVDSDADILIDRLNFSVLPGARLAIVGPNGVGKTTLLRVLAGLIVPQKGRVSVTSGSQIGYLEQGLPSSGRLEDHVADSRALRRGLSRLGLSLAFLERDVTTMSPGERMRAMLASILIQEADILLLDEPTNHLDLDGKIWLAEFLKQSPEAIVFVSHDREFVDLVANRTLEISNGAWFESSGGYTALLDAKRDRDERKKAEYVAQKSEIARLKSAVEEQKQRASKVTKRPKNQRERGTKPYYAAMEAKLHRRANAVKSRVEVEQSRLGEKPFEAAKIELNFPTRKLRSAFALQARNLSAAYDLHVVFEVINIDLEAGERIALIGANGSGKTTLLHAIMEPQRLKSGGVSWGAGAIPRLLDQTFSASDETVAALVGEEGRRRLGSVGLRGSIQTRTMSSLSMGERMRVELVRLLLEGANVLLLDEPTNHLDLPAIEALEEALVGFEGSILFVSHDAKFISKVAHRSIRLPPT